MLSLNWISDDQFEIGGVSFHATVNPAQYHSIKSEPNRFLLIKNRGMVEKELSLFGRRDVKTVLDIGIWEGGSVALFDLAFRPEKIVALELRTAPIEALRDYIERHDRSEAISVHYGVDQADRPTVRDILESEFGGAPIDIVIDDASHQYEETKTSFDTIFPYVAEGGYFVIEDWGWSFAKMSWSLPYFGGKPGLSNLVVQCMSLAVGRPDLIRSVEVSEHIAIIQRGAGTILPGEFSIDELATNRGLKMVPHL